MIPKMPVKVLIESLMDALIFDSFSRLLWLHKEARTLMLLWRPGHIVTPTFLDETLEIGKAIRKKEPQTVEELYKCMMSKRSQNYTKGDIESFCEEAIGFFNGEKQISIEIIDKE